MLSAQNQAFEIIQEMFNVAKCHYILKAFSFLEMHMSPDSF